MTHKPNSTTLSAENLAQKIDHTLLKPTLISAELKMLCEEAKKFNFKTVCIPPAFVRECFEYLEGSSVKVITVIGFPLGYSSTETKAEEAALAIRNGAQEIDMVINISFLKSKRYSEVESDIAAVVKACAGIPLKVIIETAYLDDAEKIKAAQLAESAGAAFVKTSTGFASGMPITGATVADVQLLRQNLKPTTKIKASGGIKNLEMALALLQAGADRLGTSSGVALVQGFEASGGY
jgi:deoxyribose-phosphate aldolase